MEENFLRETNWQCFIWPQTATQPCSTTRFDLTCGARQTRIAALAALVLISV